MRSRLTSSKPGLPRPVDGRRHPHRVVGAVEGPQHVVDGRLHAEADAVEARGPQLLEVPRGDAVGVGLGGDLDAVGQAELRGRARHDRAEVGGLQQRRRTSAEEDRLDLDVAVAQHVAGEADLADRRLGVRRAAGADLVAELVGGVGVEVAVAAAHAAERDVDVEAEGLAAELGPRLVGQQAVLGGDVAVGLRGGHAGIQPRRRRRTGASGLHRHPFPATRQAYISSISAWWLPWTTLRFTFIEGVSSPDSTVRSWSRSFHFLMVSQRLRWLLSSST